MKLNDDVIQKLLDYQKNEITEYHIYKKLAVKVKQPENRQVLENIAEDELRHYQVWKNYTGQDVSPNKKQIRKYYWISRIFGLTFGVKLMERGEENAQHTYGKLRGNIPDAAAIIQEENQHESALLEMLNEEMLQYTGSIVLGLNDALVELTGALAGLTLALQNTKLIALTGLITGIAAALSMGTSEYLSTKTEGIIKSPLKASVYTGITYLATVLLLVLPYLLLQNYYLCLGCSLTGAILIVAFFNYYISIAQDEPFKKRFFEMAGLSLGVATFSFLIGFVIRKFLGVEV